MGKHLTPLDVCIRLIGSIEHIGQICELSEKAAYGWKRQSGLHEAMDVRSAGHMRRLLVHSDKRGLGLTAEHLIRGADETDIEAILATRQGRPVTIPSFLRRQPEAAE